MARRTYGRLTSGFDELDKKLAELKTGVANAAVRKGQREQCKIIQQAMRSAAPNKIVKKAIGYRVGFYRGQHVAKVGIDVGKQKMSSEGRAILESAYGHAGMKASKRITNKLVNALAHLFITGTQPRFRKPSKAILRIMPRFVRNRLNTRGYTGKMRPIPGWAANATATVKSEAEQVCEQIIWSEIYKRWQQK